MKKIVVITLAIMALSIMLFAQPTEKPKMQMKDDCVNCGQHQMQGNMMGNHQDMMKSLKLTPEQMKKIDTLRDDQKKFINLKEAALENFRIDKHNAMQAEDYSKVKALNKNITDLELEIANKRADHHQAMMKELTSDQKVMMKDMMGKGMGPKDKGMMKGNKNMMHNQKGMDKPCPGNSK